MTTANYNLELCNLLRRVRTQNQLQNNPDVRTELQPSPYNRGFTKHQIDMRRKAEILQYKPIVQSSQTNSETKKQRFASIMTTGTAKRLGVTANDATANVNCTQDNLMPTPTSSSDVPGPIMNLVYDESVPLYNYKASIVNNNPR